MPDKLFIIKLLFLILSFAILVIPLILRVIKNRKVDFADPIYIFLFGFFCYLVLGQLEEINFYYLKEVQVISNQTKFLAMKYVVVTLITFVYLDFFFYEKQFSFKVINSVSYNLTVVRSFVFISILILISIIFFYMNLERFGGVLDYISMSITKGARDELMREFGNYPFDLLFYISFVATITLINFFKRNIYISIFLSVLLFSPYLLYKIILFDRSTILKFLLFILFMIIFEKKFKISLEINKTNIFLLLFFLIFSIFFLQIGEIRSSLNNLIRDKNFTFNDLKETYSKRTSKLYLREFTNTNYGFLYLIENNLSISTESNSYFQIVYSASPRSILSKFNNIKEEDPIDNIISKNISNFYFSDFLNRNNKISLANHPLTEAYYNYREISPFIAGILFFLIYKFILYFINHRDYFISRVSISIFPYLFLFWRSQLSGLVSYFFYMFIFYFFINVYSR